MGVVLFMTIKQICGRLKTNNNKYKTMAKLSQKQQSHITDVIKSLHSEILNVIMENGFLIKQENWSIEQQEIRATYDSFRIINLVNDKLSNVL